MGDVFHAATCGMTSSEESLNHLNFVAGNSLFKRSSSTKKYREESRLEREGDAQIRPQIRMQIRVSF